MAEVDVDDLDLKIFRWMYPGGLWSPWGTDPRITPSEIASHVGLDRTVVWDRIRKWRREGFWDGFDVRVNLWVFGLRQVYAQIHVTDAAQGWALLDQLHRVQGVLEARVAFADTATSRDVEAVVVEMVDDDSARVAGRMRKLRQLAPSGIVEGPFREKLAPIAHELTPLDWRILEAIVENPNASPSRLAHLVGVTVKTFVRHHSRLIEEHAVFYAPKLNWSRLGCIALVIHCRDVEAAHRVRGVLETRFPAYIPMAIAEFEGLGAEWNASTSLPVILPVRSPHGVQTVIRDLSADNGVRSVRPEYWGPGRRFPEWVQQRISERVARLRAGESRGRGTVNRPDRRGVDLESRRRFEERPSP